MTFRGRRRDRDAVWRGVDTRQRNQAIREIGKREQARAEALLPKVRTPQQPLCSLSCHGINHVEQCPNVQRCAKCRHYEFNVYTDACLFCGSTLKAEK